MSPSDQYAPGLAGLMTVLPILFGLFIVFLVIRRPLTLWAIRAWFWLRRGTRETGQDAASAYQRERERERRD